MTLHELIELLKIATDVKEINKYQLIKERGCYL